MRALLSPSFAPSPQLEAAALIIKEGVEAIEADDYPHLLSLTQQLSRAVWNKARRTWFVARIVASSHTLLVEDEESVRVLNGSNLNPCAPALLQQCVLPASIATTGHAGHGPHRLRQRAMPLKTTNELDTNELEPCVDAFPQAFVFLDTLSVSRVAQSCVEWHLMQYVISHHIHHAQSMPKECLECQPYARCHIRIIA